MSLHWGADLIGSARPVTGARPILGRAVNLLIVSILLILLFGIGEASAGTRITRGRRWALLVGVSDYEDPGINSLRFASSDADAVKQALLAVPTSGYSQETIILLNGRGENSTTSPDLRAAFRPLRARLQLDDSLLVFVSSHGVEVDDRAYLVLTDTRIDQVKETAVPVAEVFRLIRSLPVRNRILLLDACHSGASTRFPSETMGYALHDALEQGSANAAILASSKLGQQSYESDEYHQGIFTHFLTQALQGIEGIDRDHDGRISLDETARFVERHLMAWGRRAHRIQQPWLIRTGSGESPVLTSLVPETDVFGARAKEIDNIGTVALHFRIDRSKGIPIIRGAVVATGCRPGRGFLSMVVVQSNGETLRWLVPIDPSSPLNVLPEHKLDAEPTRVLLEEKLYDLGMTSFVPIRVEYEKEN